MIRHNIQIVILLFLITIPLVGETIAASATIKNEVGIILINDTLFETDKDYTGSVGIYYKFSTIPLLIKYQIDAYTPSTNYKKLLAPKKNMHPYAGFGFIGAEYKTLYNQYLFTAKLEIGATGKYSFAQKLQDIIHRSLNQPTFAGWDSQVQTNFGYIFNPKFEYIFETKFFTLLPTTSIKIGNLLSKQTLGIQLLSGINYNRDLLRKKYTAKPNYNIFIEYEVSNISKNVFLTGFKGYEYGVDINNTVSELKIGLDVQYKSFGITFNNHYQSKEYEKQEKANRYSTLVLYFSF